MKGENKNGMKENIEEGGNEEGIDGNIGRGV